jgi:hypothetical protein
MPAMMALDARDRTHAIAMTAWSVRQSRDAEEKPIAAKLTEN